MTRGKTRMFGVALILVALTIFGGTFRSLYQGESNESQFKVPGTFQARAEPGRTYVWNNHTTMFEGQAFRSDREFPAEFEITVRDANGDPLKFVQDNTESYNVGNHAKTSVGYVESDKAIGVEIEVQGDHQERVLSFSKSGTRQVMGTTFTTLGSAALIALAGLALLLFGLAKRPANST